ncbi:helix-turn-helix domain-containing protein [Clostridium botulinum]|uniref:helix-turn-helix domain-containing protein n=1 Tax=Clostridium botulinum TaxID=1491 RepID=UPI00140185BF|nr:helix-turn-helix transcriptional regulator [Clostridium botulinum]MBY6915508.1 helix-turn-helix transcriptional regulator [Clostridium botulinum]NFQ38276.1 helix-turn-helix transcriptional regulator [Clostridium botulinum]
MIGEELREEFGMTQDQLASILNVSRQSISGYENNSNEPSLENLVKLSDLFNVSADYLLNRTKERENLNLLGKCNKELLLKLYYLMEGYKIIKK